jgi:DNA-binding MarR family transcriptional regulator
MVKKKKKKDKKEKSKKGFKGNVMEAVQNVHYLYDRTLDSTFSELDLSNEQFRILKILNDGAENGYTLRKIREALPNQTSNASRLVGKLHLKKMVQKKSSKSDKRELRITLTSIGADVFKAAKKKIERINAELESILKSKSATAMIENLDSISQVLNDVR